MMALSKKMLEQEPGEIELLLPWHAAGTLNPRDARRVDEALARDPELAKQYAAIRGEYEETIHLNEDRCVIHEGHADPSIIDARWWRVGRQLKHSFSPLLPCSPAPPLPRSPAPPLPRSPALLLSPNPASTGISRA